MYTFTCFQGVMEILLIRMVGYRVLYRIRDVSVRMIKATNFTDYIGFKNVVKIGKIRYRLTVPFCHSSCLSDTAWHTRSWVFRKSE